MAVTLPLLLARCGYHIFPLAAGAKVPCAGTRGHLEATTDEPTIHAWAALHPGCGWGIACEPSGLAIVDVDVDVKADKPGDSTLALLEIEHGDLTPTMVVYTPSGGRHLYFRGVCPSSQGDRNGLGPGLDTRGAGGYVVAPGCATAAGKYRIEGGRLCRVDQLSPIPDWVVDRLGSRRAPRADVQLDLDEEQEESLYQHACDWLAHARPAIEGQGGDQTTYETACRLRDMGLAQEDALAALLEAYDPRCEPPWGPEALATKVQNAYRYARSTPGIFAAEAVFSPVAEIEVDEIAWTHDPFTRRSTGRHDPVDRTVLRASAIDALAIPPRAWVLGHRLIRDYVTVTVAPGGIGKSVLTTLEALALASGRDLTGEPPIERGPVLIVSTEDPPHEIQRRLAAACLHHQIALAALDHVHYLSATQQPLRLVVPGERFGEVVVDERQVKWLIDYIRRHGIVAATFDPFVRTHMISENDNMAVDAVVQCFSRIALEAHCAVSLVHHTRKLGDAGGRGNAETARGASSLISACRVAHTLDVMDAQEAEKFGVPEDERRWWLRLDDAKSNLAPPAEGVRWFRRESISLPNGDAVGTMRLALAEELVARVGDELALAAALLALFEEDPLQVLGQAPHALGRLLQTRTAVMPGASEDKVRRSLVRVVEKGLALRDGRVLRLAPAGGGRGRRVVEVVDAAGEGGS